MWTLKVGNAEQYQDIDQNETRLRVPFKVFDENDVMVEERIDSFSITATKDEVQETLERHLAVIEEDHKRYEANKEREAALAQSQEVADTISGITI
jgi:uncharacterized membrane protein